MGKALLLGLLVTTGVNAEIINSNYEVRLNNAIENAITNECNQMLDLTILSSKIVEDRIDQGITDLKITTTLSGKQRYDQNIFDQYEIVVESEYADAYDHATGEYGWYDIKSVECKMLF
ncbi:hypothetical protein [Bacteriovorax sp. DB6_IX]|uniref:hypothetical protein n=1 Tax=Bacteriovorax sp. DB6_IX TaxID=1353530 RepID=UPI00038A3870|nr:hypothetical protein [Bacteriovorax sp. DB6_IX]EQC50994.1 hypothetical protein M901_1329 [Bacteriovorax sp. DB6_IX]